MYVINYAAEHEQLVRGMEDHVQPGLHPVSAAGRAHNNHWMSLFDIDEASTGRTDMYYIGLFHLQQIHVTVMFKIRKCPILNGPTLCITMNMNRPDGFKLASHCAGLAQRGAIVRHHGPAKVGSHVFHHVFHVGNSSQVVYSRIFP
jgi:hypothetical protein